MTEDVKEESEVSLISEEDSVVFQLFVLVLYLSDFLQS